MKTINKIIGIGIIALIAIVSVGAVSADETLENVGAHLTPTVAPHTYEKGILTIPISNGQLAGMNPDFTTSVPDGVATPDRDDCGSLNDLPGLEGIGEWTLENSEPTSVWLVTAGKWNPSHPEPTIDLDGHGNTISTQDVTGYFHSGDFQRGSAEDTTSMEFGDI